MTFGYFLRLLARIVSLTVTFAFLLPLLPGIVFNGSLLTAVLLSLGLWVVFELNLNLAVRFSYEGTWVPMGLVVWFVAALYMAFVGLYLETPFSVAGLVPCVIAGFFLPVAVAVPDLIGKLFRGAPK